MTSKMNLLESHPNIIKEWHPLKNGDLKPEQFTFGSEKKIWWLCPNTCNEGCIHEYEMMICNRTKGSKCIFCCIPRKSHCIHESINFTNPELSKEWHPTKNGNLKPEHFSIGSHKKIWWICKNTCKEGCIHEWEAVIKSRINGYGCPFCSLPAKDFCIHNSLSYLQPELIKQWHPTKNGDKKPEDFSVCSGQKIWWLCPNTCKEGCKHEWLCPISHRKNGSQCPYCIKQKICIHDSIIYSHPELSKEWHPTKNGDLKPEEFSSGSGHTKIWWLCEKTCKEGCKHEWEAVIYSRTNNQSGCPYCCHNTQQLCIHESIVYSHPELVKQWHPTKNEGLKPEQFSAGSNKNVWWYKTCNIGGCIHEWQSCIANITNRNINNGPISVLCIHESIVYSHPELVKQWHPTKNEDLIPTQITQGSDKKIWWICNKNHTFQSRVSNRTRLNRGCPYCINKTEQKLYDILIIHYLELKIQFKVDWCKNKNYLPFDFVLENDKIIIELDGLQHFEQVSNWVSPEETHINDKYKMKCANANDFSVIRLLQTDVFYDTYNWLEELKTNIEKIKTDKIIQNIYMCKDNEYEIFQNL